MATRRIPSTVRKSTAATPHAEGPMVLPDYRGGSIVNLVSSIQHATGKPSRYAPLRLLPPAELKSKNVVLIVIDGMGYELLRRHGQETLLWQHCRGPITSVFPSTTAAAVTAFDTGVAPQQHAITGWYVHLKELGGVYAILPMFPRAGGESVERRGLRRELIFDTPHVYDKRDYIITYPEIVHEYEPRGINVRAFKGMPRFFAEIRDAIRKPGRKYIHAYWHDLDHLEHKHGHTASVVHEHLRAMDRGLRRFLKSIEGTDTTVIITADHGQMITTPKHVIKVSDHPVLEDTLALPICGEPRAAYCYVRPGKTGQFERYVTTKLKHCCTLLESEEAVRQGWFGLGKEHPKLRDRIGDYVLVMKPGYILRWVPINKKFDYDIGNHGGVTSEEMLVPLIVIRP